RRFLAFFRGSSDHFLVFISRFLVLLTTFGGFWRFFLDSWYFRRYLEVLLTTFWCFFLDSWYFRRHLSFFVVCSDHFLLFFFMFFLFFCFFCFFFDVFFVFF